MLDPAFLALISVLQQGTPGSLPAVALVCHTAHLVFALLRYLFPTWQILSSLTVQDDMTPLLHSWLSLC